jgi:hypothetical protein
MIEAIEYDYRHRKHMIALLASRSMPVELIEDLPENGIIVLDLSHHHEPAIAAGFLRIIEDKFGLLDAFITNPLEPSIRRDAALDLLTNKLINLGIHLGLSNLFAFSKDESILGRSKRFGFKDNDMKLISMSLDGGIGIWGS